MGSKTVLPVKPQITSVEIMKPDHSPTLSLLLLVPRAHTGQTHPRYLDEPLLGVKSPPCNSSSEFKCEFRIHRWWCKTRLVRTKWGSLYGLQPQLVVTAACCRLEKPTDRIG